jgi:ACS family D-galactonate transporter-like MFS transporter
MTATAPSPAHRVTKAEWIALWLLVVSVCINYLDRGNLSVAGVQIQKELHLTNTEEGLLLAAFFVTYAGCQMIAAWLIERFNVVWVYALGFLIWSGATLLTGFAAAFSFGVSFKLFFSFHGEVTGFAMLFLLRLLLGISESVAYPAYSKIIAAGFPERKRGIANGLIDAGCKLGPAVGILVGGYLLQRFGWRMMFIVIGAVSMIWLIPWVAIGGSIKTGRDAKLSEGRTDVAGFREIVRQREAWGTFLGLFCGNYAWYFMLTWLPQYFIKVRHYSTEMMTRWVPLPFLSVAAGAVFAGWAADRWIHHGGTPTQVRKAFTGGGLALWALIFLPAGFVKDTQTALWLMVVAGFFFGLFSGNHWAVSQTLAGTAAAGKWTGIQNMCGNFAGIVVPVMTGVILDKTGQFYWAVASVCGVALIGALSYLVIIRRIEPVSWHAGPAVKM